MHANTCVYFCLPVAAPAVRSLFICVLLWISGFWPGLCDFPEDYLRFCSTRWRPWHWRPLWLSSMGWPWWQHCSQSSSLCVVVLCELHRLWSHYSNLLIHPWPGRWSRLPGRPCASMTSMAGISMYCMPWSPRAPSKLSRSRCLCLNAFVRIDDSVLLELKYAVGKTHLAFEMMANLKRPLRNPATPSCEIRSGDWSSENGQRRTQHCSSYWYPNYLSIRQNRHQREPFSSADHDYSRGLYKSSQQAGLGLGTSCDIRGIGEVTLHGWWAVCARRRQVHSRLCR